MNFFEYDYVSHFFEDNFDLTPDSRTKDWPFMNGTVTLAVSFLYILIVKIGQQVMKDKAPMNLKLIRILHNAVLVALSLYMSYETAYRALEGNYSMLCNPLDTSQAGLPMAAIVYIFYVSKTYEFVDTFIMVLRKSNQQISFLHLYHHSSILFIWWFNMRYQPGGDAWLSTFLNSFVHVWMYSYYLFSTLGYQAWWKKYITQFQIIQFVSFVVQGLTHTFTGCLPSIVAVTRFNTLYAATLLVLFANFYLSSYKKAAKHQKKR